MPAMMMTLRAFIHCHGTCSEMVIERLCRTSLPFGRLMRPPTKAWADDVPYNCSIIELDEGPHLWSSVVGLPADDVKIGDRVEVTYDDVTPEVTIPRFRPIP